jgi:UDP-GlcNAc:undecaprenyl-phosphate GlcNAc-1-phosphate transferase
VLSLALLGFAAALGWTALATPVVRALALGRNLIDRPDHRKVHTEAVPRLGGVALAVGLLLAGATVALVSPAARDLLASHVQELASLVAAAWILGTVGLLDDLRSVGPRTKLLAQVAAGLLTFAGGNRLHLFEGAVVGPPAALLLNLLATLLWVVAITNAMNLIDGLDGLATGITTIVVLALGVLSLAAGHAATAVVAITLAGATVGFLPYNVHPARIFLGDSGSLLLGGLLAILSVQPLQQRSPLSSVVLLLFLFSVPLLDVGLAVVRRLLRGHAVMSADGNHIHHRLLRGGLGHARSVALLWVTTLVFVILALGLVFLRDSPYAGVLRLSTFVLLLAAARWLGALEFRDLAHTIGRRERRRHSPRDRNLAVRRALKDLAAWRDVEGLDDRLIALARQIDLDLIDIEVALPTDGPARAVPVVRWVRDREPAPGDGGAVPRDDGAGADARAISTIAAAVDGPSGLRGTVVVGRERWKLRRQSEEARIWAHLLAEGVGSIDGALAVRLAARGRTARRAQPLPARAGFGDQAGRAAGEPPPGDRP